MTRRCLTPEEDEARGPKFLVYFKNEKALDLMGGGNPQIKLPCLSFDRQGALFNSGNSMNGWFYFKLYLLTIPVFFAIDLLWLGVVAKDLYQKNLGHLLSPDVNWPAAFAFYFMYIAGIILFAVRPALADQSLFKAVLWGALFGFFTYATYDLTNLATLKAWPIKIVFIDIAWGVALCSLVASASYQIGRWLNG